MEGNKKLGRNPLADRQSSALLRILTDLNYRAIFNDSGLIFVPPWKSMPASWKEPDDCLWDAPSDFITKIPLKEIYVSSFQNLDFTLDHVADLFRGTLEIPDIDWPSVIAELEELKLQPTIKGEVVRQLYSILLEKLQSPEVDRQEIR